MKKLVIFDLDGTLLDTLSDLTNAVNYALGLFSKPLRTKEEVRSFIGNGTRKLMERAIDNLSLVDEAYQQFHHYYGQHYAVSSKAYAGINDLLYKLKGNGIILACVSNKNEYVVKELLEMFFPNIFDYCLGDKENQRRKPYPDTVNQIISNFKFEKEEVIYVGDSEVDYQTAINAQIDYSLVSWGYRDVEELKKMEVNNIVYSTDELFDKIVLTQKHPFKPIYDENSEILILGSFPSVKSREANFYYMHPQNRFWKMLEMVYEETINDKGSFILKHNLGLWDVIESCTIDGSNDASIKDVKVNDLKKIIDASKIKIIICNGNKAYKLFKKYCDVDIAVYKLPSTSSANTAYSIQRLVTEYRKYLLK